MSCIVAQDASEFLTALPVASVDLLCIDPPYFGIVKDSWDNEFSSPSAFAQWLVTIVNLAKPAMTPTGSLILFQGIGKHGLHPIFDVVKGLEQDGWIFRNWITWKKRRAYGKSHDYLFCREEILWFSMSEERTDVTFNIPLTTEKRGYAGFNEKYPAKSEYKRVSNVWDDIPELMRPERNCQKPRALMDRLIQTHSNPGSLVVDCFSGYGSTGISAVSLGRRFLGCEKIPHDAEAANARILAETRKEVLG